MNEEMTEKQVSVWLYMLIIWLICEMKQQITE